MRAIAYTAMARATRSKISAGVHVLHAVMRIIATMPQGLFASTRRLMWAAATINASVTTATHAM